MSKSTVKALKYLVVKGVKQNYPKFSTHKKKQKKEILTNIWNEVYHNYDFSHESNLPKQDLLNLEPLPKNIITIEQMKKRMTEKQVKLLPLVTMGKKKHIICHELKAIDDKMLEYFFD